MSYIKYESWDWHQVEELPTSFYLFIVVVVGDVRRVGWWVARQARLPPGRAAQDRNEVDVTLNSVKTSQELGELSLWLPPARRYNISQTPAKS